MEAPIVHTVTMMCLTTKKKFDVDDPEVVILANGRYAYRAKCPWGGKNGKELVAYKFCGLAAHQRYIDNTKKIIKGETEEEGEIEIE